MNTTILDKVQQRTPDKVVYCLTHFDRLCSDKDVRIEEIMRIINVSANEIACNRDMFLLSLSKRVENLTEKESISMASERECPLLMAEMFYQEEGLRVERG